MARSGLERAARSAIRRSIVATRTAGEVTRTASGPGDSQLAGSNGPSGTDPWQPYGLTDYTPLDQPFTCNGLEKDW